MNNFDTKANVCLHIYTFIHIHCYSCNTFSIFMRLRRLTFLQSLSRRSIAKKKARKLPCFLFGRQTLWHHACCAKSSSSICTNFSINWSSYSNTSPTSCIAKNVDNTAGFISSRLTSSLSSSIWLSCPNYIPYLKPEQIPTTILFCKRV